MSIGVISGFNPTVGTTTAKTHVLAGPAYITARIVNASTSGTLTIYNSANTTAAASRVAILKVVARGADELGAPIRCDVGVTVKSSVNSTTWFVYIR